MASASAQGSVGSAQGGQTLTVDLDALFREIEQAQKTNSPDGLTTLEVAQAIGKSRIPTCNLIRQAIAMGKCKPVRVRRVGMDQVARMIPGYVFEA